MAKEDLIDISTRKDFKEITAKGGRAKTEKKRNAAKLRAIKLMKPETIEKKALLLASDPDISAQEIMRYAQSILKREDLNDSLKIQLLGKITQAHTAIHGIKSKTLTIGLSKQIVEVRFKKEEDEGKDRDKRDSIELRTTQKSKDISSEETEV